jgi:hypothetical protein
MTGRVVSHVEFLDVRRRRQRVLAELARRSRDNTTLWKTLAPATEPPAPSTESGGTVAVTVPDPRP